MADELRSLYYITKSLVWGIVAILVAVLALLVFSLVLPFMLRSLLSSALLQQNQSVVAVALAAEIRNLAGLASLMFILAIVVIFILIIVSIVLGVFKSKPLTQIRSTDEAMQTLKERYAKGEITRAQFLEMKSTLKNEN